MSSRGEDRGISVFNRDAAIKSRHDNLGVFHRSRDMTHLLPNPDFLTWLLRAIAQARRSIILVNYLATLEEHPADPVARVARALVAARRRGVAIEVILEGSKFRENYSFYRVLKAAGCDVWMDTSLTFIHTKAVLVDDRLLCVGSHNLTASALVTHHELSAAFCDPAAVRRFHAELARITAQRRQIADDVCRKGTTLPLSIIISSPLGVIPRLDRGIPIDIEIPRSSRGMTALELKRGCGKSCAPPLVALKRSISPHAYLLYLLLCRLDGGKPREVAVDAEGWAAKLGLPKSVASARVQVEATLDLMDRKLHVVQYDRQGGRVRRAPIPSCKEHIFILDSFWKYNWHRRLPVEAIHLYFAGEAERTTSPFAPWWRLKRDEIAEKYGFSKALVNRAQRELKRAGLLEILFESADAPEGRYARYMNYFRQNPFYDAELREKKMGELTRRYPKAVGALAQRLTSLVEEDADVEKRARLCNLIRKTGIPRARRILGIISRLSPNSTKRTFEYVQELLSGTRQNSREEG